MVNDLLSECLAACQDLTYRSYCLKCELFDVFRKTAWRIIRDPQRALSPQADSISRRVWKLVYDLSRTPLPWSHSFSKQLGFEGADFVVLAKNHLSETQADIARKLQQLWESMTFVTHASSPIKNVLREQISCCRDDMQDFRVLASGQQQRFYRALLEELELDRADVFCTASNIKHLAPFCCLITCGPFCEHDSLFTAPRYSTIVNIRWADDHDIPGFPDYVSLESQSDANDQFPSNFPCRVNNIVERRAFDYARLPTLCAAEEWSFHEFEQLYIKRHSRLKRVGWILRGAGPNSLPQDMTGSTHPNDVQGSQYVHLGFFDGSSLTLPFDQQHKPPLLLSIDRESDFEIKKRRPIEDFVGNDDEEGLRPGMLVIIEPDATASLANAATEQRHFEVFHLPKWKSLLEKKCADLRSEHISTKFAMQSVGLAEEYVQIEGNLRWWCKHEPGKTNAPGTEEAFRKLVGDFAEYPDWEAAWQEVCLLRNEAISVGLTRESAIDQYLKVSVEQRLGEVLDSSKTVLEVKGFVHAVIVIEVSEICFLNEREASGIDIGKYVDESLDDGGQDGLEWRK